MERVLLTDSAAEQVRRIQGNVLNTFSDEKGVIADCFGVLSTLLCLGRDCEEIQNNVDGILNVLEALNRYNDLLKSLNNTSERTFGSYEYVEPEKDYDEDSDAAVCYADGKALERVFSKHGIQTICAPATADTITMAEAAKILECTIDELKQEVNEERSTL